jgi:hypothetical protein
MAAAFRILLRVSRQGRCAAAAPQCSDGVAQGAGAKPAKAQPAGHTSRPAVAYARTITQQQHTTTAQLCCAAVCTVVLWYAVRTPALAQLPPLGTSGDRAPGGDSGR